MTESSDGSAKLSGPKQVLHATCSPNYQQQQLHCCILQVQASIPAMAHCKADSCMQIPQSCRVLMGLKFCLFTQRECAIKPFPDAMCDRPVAATRACLARRWPPRAWATMRQQACPVSPQVWCVIVSAGKRIRSPRRSHLEGSSRSNCCSWCGAMPAGAMVHCLSMGR